MIFVVRKGWPSRGAVLVSVAMLWLAVIAAACPDEGGDLDSDTATDGPSDGADGDGTADQDSGHDVDGPDEPAADLPEDGPWTQVASAVEFSADRVCDHDGDGVADNAAADLGDPHSSLFTASINSFLANRLEDLRRFVVHSPWVDDLRTPQDDRLRLIFVNAEDVEHPDDPSNDFSGEEPFWADFKTVDACGEPLFVVEDARLEGGELTASGVSVPVMMADSTLVVGGGALSGTVPPGGNGAEIGVCGYATVHELGDAPAIEAGTDRTLLETLLYGGAAFGVPSVPGLSPDVDLDGDGLERLVLDDDGYLISCIDGDDSIYSGRDCWVEPGMADAFALVLSIATVGAVFSGLMPGWEVNFADAPCETPPETSLWDPS